MIALLRKEWREHRIAIAVLYLIGLLMLAVEWKQAEDAISPLAAWHGMVIRFGTVAALYAANRLVMREYGAGTQLFLETLPVSRTGIVLAKWLAGWCALLLFMAPAFGAILWLSRGQVDLDAHFAALMAGRAAAYLLLVYAAAFAIALTLRLRLYLWFALLVTAAMLDHAGQLPIEDWAAFHLVKLTMVLERSQAPWWELGVTTALALGLLALSTAMAALARGALVIALARRPSARTRSLLALGFGILVGVAMLLEKRVDPPPLRMQEAAVSRSRPEVRIGWRHPIGGVPAAEVAARISRDLARMQEWLGLGELTETSLVADAWSDPARFRIGQGAPDQLVMHAALGHPDLPLRELEAALRRAHLVKQSPLYGWREDRTWLIAGFGLWWGTREDPALRALLERRALAAARWLKVYGVDTATALAHGATTREMLGECLSGALSWRALQVVADRLGPRRFQVLMRQALGEALPDTLRGLFAIRASAALLEEAGLPPSQLAAALHQALPAGAGHAMPALRFDAAGLEGAMVELRYRMVNRPAGDVTIHYRSLLPAESTVHDTAAWPGAPDSGVLPATFVRGRHVLVFAEARDPDLGCTYRFGATRRELP
jgi:hypothetical protein